MDWLPATTRVSFGSVLGLILIGVSCASCASGLLGEIPLVESPLPQLHGPEFPEVGSVIIVNDWIFYSVPPEKYGVPILRAQAGTEWKVTGRWRPSPPVSGNQWWVLTHYRDWYRLNAEVPPYGLVSVWGQLPVAWLREGQMEDVPWVEPPWGQVWNTVPFSAGRVLVSSDDHLLDLHVCPDIACPIWEQPVSGDAVPVTGQYEAEEGLRWWRVEFEQVILWVPVSQGSLHMTLLGWARHVGLTQGAGWRSCQPIVLFPPPPNTLCAVNHEGRLLDEFEREYDWLDPVFGRLAPPASSPASQ